MVLKALRVAGSFLSFLFNYLLAGGSLVAAIILLLALYEIISQTRASYPPLPPISGSSLTKPIFLRSVPVQVPKTCRGAARSVSPDGKKMAYWGVSEGTGEQGLFVADIDSDEGTLIWRFVTWQAWSPDSTMLLLQAREDQLGAGGIAVAGVDDASLRWVIPPPDEPALALSLSVATASWSPDGKAVLFVQSKTNEGTSELWRLELENGQRQRLAVLPREPDKPNTFVRNLSVSPDGKKVSFVNADRPGAEKSSTWWIMNLDGSSPLPLMRRSQDAGFVQNWLWSPNGRQLMFDVKTVGDANYQPTTLWIMNSDGTARRQISGSDNIDGFAISPKGNWAIYGKESHLWLANLESGQEEQLTFGDDNESRPLWLANGDVLYHLRVGSITSLRLLDHAEVADIPGLATPTPSKSL